jgi:hypothetical protein
MTARRWIFAVVTIAAAISVCSAAVVIATNAIVARSPPGGRTSSELGFFDGTSNSLILDRKGDAKPEQQYASSVVPEVKGYHDIVAASVKKVDGRTITMSIMLAGDPNLNEKYETNYMWHIITPTNKTYTVLFPNFAQDSNFTLKGWFFAVFNNTSGKYVVPLTRVASVMPNDRVEFPLDVSYIGSPKSFYYWVSVSVRVDTKNLDKPPEFLMDHAP